MGLGEGTTYAHRPQQQPTHDILNIDVLTTTSHGMNGWTGSTTSGTHTLHEPLLAQAAQQSERPDWCTRYSCSLADPPVAPEAV